MREKVWKIIHGVFKIRIFEKLLLIFVTGKYASSFVVKFVPPFYTYSDTEYRIAKKNKLRLYAKMQDYNDWKAYWGIKEIEREKLYALAKEAKVVIDIGTNNGWVLMNFAEIISKNNGFVYGFEPFPETYDRCVYNIKMSGIANAEVFKAGCGERESSYCMKVEKKNNSGQNRIVPSNCTGADEYEVIVTVIALDHQLPDLKNVDLIKIDVEGFELNVIKGAVNTIKKHLPILFIEINDPLLKANNTNPEEVLNFLQSNFGYTFKNAFDGSEINSEHNFSNRQLDVICYPGKNNS